MKRLNRFLVAPVSLTLAAALLISPCALAASRETNAALEGGGSAGADGFANGSHFYGPESGVVAKKAAFFETVQQRMLKREETFSVPYDGPLNQVYTNFTNLLDAIYTYNDEENANVGDYLRYNCVQMGLDISYTPTACVFTFHAAYRTTALQEHIAEDRVNAILSDLNLSSKDDYTKIKTVYEYMRTHFSYDATGTKRTAYDGLSSRKMTSEGYALLTYHLLTRLSIPARVISGTLDGKPWTWNLVCLGGAWYNLDAAGNSVAGGAASNQYFLKNQEDFSGHIRESRYATAFFLNAFPIADRSFIQSDETGTVGCLSVLGVDTLQKGGNTALSVQIFPVAAQKAPVVWTSSDPKIAAVDQAGGVTALEEGTAVISAAAAGGSVSARRSITVVDFSRASAWARKELQALYETGIIPQGVLRQYTASMTRAEFTALLVRLCESQIGVQPLLSTSFLDTAGHPYEQDIAKGYHLNLVNGKSSVRFAPDDPITRQEAAKMLCSAFAVLKGMDEAPQTDSSDAEYTDEGKIGAWALPYVAYLTQSEIFQGSGGAFMPMLNLTREQGMVLAQRMTAAFSSKAVS